MSAVPAIRSSAAGDGRAPLAHGAPDDRERAPAERIRPAVLAHGVRQVGEVEEARGDEGVPLAEHAPPDVERPREEGARRVVVPDGEVEHAEV
ncbi:MAG TPA: hypothetical protein VEB59_03820, partial [Gemmatimonadales bacterium]|nr:hypothetical protein [Gemmatimonadales bacterium]